jgi:uncharacterized membrane protein
MPYRCSPVAELSGQQWLVRRNCALSPRQLGLWFGALAAVSVGLAGVFAAQGAWLILPFTAVELLALAIAFVAYARHAGDYERILVTPERIVVERWTAGKMAREEVGPEWARIEYESGRRGVIRVVAGRKRVAVGSFLPEECREQLVRELRASLAGRRG